MDYDFITGDTGSKLRVTCKDSATKAVMNLAGATVTLSWKSAAGAVVSRAMTLVDAPGGIAEYQFATAELFQATMSFQVKIVDAATKIVRSINTIEAAVGPALA